MINNHDWKIHKILQEYKDAQHTQRLMLMLGRGNGKTRLIEEELEYVCTHCKPKPVTLRNSDIELIRRVVCDRDMEQYILSPYRDWVDKVIEENMKESYRKERELWEPKIYISTRLYDTYTFQLDLYREMFKDKLD